MNRIASLLLGGLLVSLLCASPSSALNYNWKLADPSGLVAYQVGGGVITIASTNLLTCQTDALVLGAKAFVYDFKVGSPAGVLCLNNYAAQIAAYYQHGSPSTVKVKTKSGTMTITVRPAPPGQPSIGHLPFH